MDGQEPAGHQQTSGGGQERDEFASWHAQSGGGAAGDASGFWAQVSAWQKRFRSDGDGSLASHLESDRMPSVLGLQGEEDAAKMDGDPYHQQDGHGDAAGKRPRRAQKAGGGGGCCAARPKT